MAKSKIESEVNARVLQINVAPGDHVNEDDTLLLVESMKMEIPITATVAGTITTIHVETGQTIDEGQLLMELD